MPPERQRPYQGPRNSSCQRAKKHLSLAVALSTIYATEQFLARFHPNFDGEHPAVGMVLSPLFPFLLPPLRTCGSTAM
ncbi:hypothetical protein TNCV_1838211 [Trichonephila clavipes]|nr:hypothetical protein TNCV_1838211 [Trichonephila clavipes]